MSQIEINVRIWGSSVNSFYKLSYSVCLTFAYFMKLFSLAKRRSTYAVDSILTLMTYLSIHTTNLWSALLKEVKPEAHQLQAVPWILLPVIRPWFVVTCCEHLLAPRTKAPGIMCNNNRFFGYIAIWWFIHVHIF